MSIDVTWPVEKSTYEKAAVDCLKEYFSSDGLGSILKMSTSDQRNIFELIQLGGHHVDPILLKR